MPYKSDAERRVRHQPLDTLRAREDYVLCCSKPTAKGGVTMSFDRRRFLSASAAALAAPYVSTSRAAGSLSVGFWDHWVPRANDGLTKLCNEWAAKEKVDLKIDYITSQGNKLLLTITAEAQAKAGHDILALATAQTPAQEANLEPVDEVVQALIE